MGWASAAAYALATAVSVVYLALINHDEADRTTVWSFVFPTWPVVGVLALAAVLFVVGTVFAAAVYRGRGGSAKSPTLVPTAASKAQPVRASIGVHYRDHGLLRSHKRMDGTRRVVWVENGFDVGRLLPNAKGGWDIVDAGGDDIGDAATEASACALLEQYVMASDAT